jgi:ankyrin repeat protein
MGETTLFLAARVGHESIVSLLIDNNMDISAQDKDGETALFQAEANGCDGVVRLLIDCSANISTKNIYRSTLLHKVATRKDAATVCLHRAVVYRYKTVTRLLIDCKANVSARTFFAKRTPLHMAAAAGREVLASLLIDCGADVSPRDRFGITPLHEAVKRGCDSTVRVIIDKGADISAVSKGRTALHIATGRRGRHSEAIVCQLIDNGIEISAVDRNGRTALHNAAMKLNAKFARLLLELDADNSIKGRRRENCAGPDRP